VSILKNMARLPPDAIALTNTQPSHAAAVRFRLTRFPPKLLYRSYTRTATRVAPTITSLLSMTLAVALWSTMDAPTALRNWSRSPSNDFSYLATRAPIRGVTT
jgi:hypothetical protein